MNARPTKRTKDSGVIFAPGDQVVRYSGGQPFFCTVIAIEPDDCLRVSCSLWPSGYSAQVTAQEVALVCRSGLGHATGF
jgi:hypothetical protein